MNANDWHRFEDEFAIRIAEKISSLYHAQQVTADVVQHESGHPSWVRIGAKSREGDTGFPYLLNVHLTWHERAIKELLANPDNFDAYLESLPGKMQGWMQERPIDFGSRTQHGPLERLYLDHFDV
ncbi:DUF5594 family protein [Burkholderia gladioli pv. gladioli]|uniref:DUF5594 family protein n=1 Tax=Burkholderia gladioli TaxID=28095 RepID=UPI0009B87344|nr:DUF5594 family protein [Burkholderia gladioli]ASD83719.1 hypothetical protein CEJ98_33310 [Burkholderia gladioli pv. gladioli]AWY51141.1 hypothetical protein A8H28_08075 [Burkholderia gladioli pv. gladioli]MDJ1166667.1 DUF5594 family protein [Burkholderia gladioli pv. gladioli]